MEERALLLGDKAELAMDKKRDLMLIDYFLLSWERRNWERRRLQLALDAPAKWWLEPVGVHQICPPGSFPHSIHVN